MQLEDGISKLEETFCKSMTSFCGDAFLAEDAVQQAYLKAMINRELLESMPEKAFKAWLYATARNYIVDQMRRKKNVQTQELDSSQADKGNLEDEISSKMLVKRGISCLNEDLRRVVYMRYYKDMNATQIGEALGLPPPTVRSKLRKAMSLMKKELEKKL